MNHERHVRIGAGRRRARARRGNAIILVAGILVLLVIIATAYVTRTQSGRVAAVAVQRASTRDNNAKVIADMIAAEIAGSLFVEPVDSTPPFPYFLPADNRALSDAPRLSPLSLRYGVDPVFPYNFAPYQVVPFTNWPDTFGDMSGLAEGNPVGNPGFGDTRWLRDTEPLRVDMFPNLGAGNRGDGRPDSFKYWRHLSNISRPNNGWRICADISNVSKERIVAWNQNDPDQQGLGLPVEQWLVDVQPMAANFRLDTGDSNLFNLYADSNGNGESDFIDRWADWLLYDYENAFDEPTLDPPNFYRLRDLDGDGLFHEEGERPQDEFARVLPGFDFGAPRWLVNRVLNDTDGDGYTDSFWFLAPTPIERGVRQIVGVSIVDNSALFNVNVATGFWPGNNRAAGDQSYSPDGRDATRGETPADLAAIGQPDPTGPEQWPPVDPGGPPPPASWNVGFFDAFENWERTFDYPNWYGGVSRPLYGRGIDTEWKRDLWPDFLRERGIADNPSGLFDYSEQGNPSPLTLATALERRRSWLGGGSRPFDPRGGLTPFSLEDELELRMYHGQNYPWVYSRLEGSMNESNDTVREDNFLRSSFEEYLESNAQLQQLRNTELLYDHRRKMTTYSGARNDLLPPWLRWRLDEVPADIGDNQQRARFLNQALLKLDLREEPPIFFLPEPLFDGTYDFRDRLPWVLLHAFADGDEVAGESFLGRYPGSTTPDELRNLAASFTANILAYSDIDHPRGDDAPLLDKAGLNEAKQNAAVPLPEWGSLPEDETVRYLGMERQPFLMEVFVGHVYKLWEIPSAADGTEWINTGEKLLLSEDEGGAPLQSTISVVQIANPFDEPIVLYDPLNDEIPHYRIDFFGEVVSLRDIAAALAESNEPFVLPPARHHRPATMILYSIDGAFDSNTTDPDLDFRTKWIRFLDLEEGDHPIDADSIQDDTILVDLNDLGLAWDFKRDDYDELNDAGNDKNITLIRVDDPLAKPTPVVIDRIDYGNPKPGTDEAEMFREKVGSLEGTSNASFPTWVQLTANGTNIPLTTDPPTTRYPEGTATRRSTDPPVPAITNETHWVQWARTTRAWARDEVGLIPLYSDPAERNPRYIYASRDRGWFSTSDKQDFPSADPRGNLYVLLRRWSPPSVPVEGVLFKLEEPADGDPIGPGEDYPWLTLDHDLPDGGTRNRKPTFFNMANELDPAGPGAWGYPDKGFYHSPYSLQMLQKNSSFEQVGELLNVWLYGHELSFSGATYAETRTTFAEYMARFQAEAVSASEPPARQRYINRLYDYDRATAGPVIGIGVDPLNPLEPRLAVPDLPAGLRVLDAFVCDGRGQLEDFDRDGFVGDVDDLNLWPDFRYANAGGFDRRITPGLININTAPVEVLRTLPHWNKLVHTNPGDQPPDPLKVPLNQLARTAIAEAAVSYRERFENFVTVPGASIPVGFRGGPDYRDRPAEFRGDRGFASIGELRRLDRVGLEDLSPLPLFGVNALAWKADFAADNPFNPTFNVPPFDPAGAYIGTDVNQAYLIDANVDPTDATDPRVGDGVSEDSEEANLLISGAANLLTTRSDVFTVHFRVRSFRQNPDTLRWDATDPEYIVDDSRYVMLVDRSEVNRPTDKPRILFLEKLPN